MANEKTMFEEVFPIIELLAKPEIKFFLQEKDVQMIRNFLTKYGFCSCTTGPICGPNGNFCTGCQKEIKKE